MVNATVDNEPVSVQLDDGESTTVPTGELWRVVVNCAPAYALTRPDETTSGKDTDHNHIRVNGTIVASSRCASAFGDWGMEDSVNTDLNSNTVPCNLVVVGGDTVEADGGGVIITGFVVN